MFPSLRHDPVDREGRFSFGPVHTDSLAIVSLFIPVQLPNPARYRVISISFLDEY